MLDQHPASWSKNGIIAYSDSNSTKGNLCITFLENINGSNWRFHPPARYVIHPQLHEVPISSGSKKTNSSGSNTTVATTAATVSKSTTAGGSGSPSQHTTASNGATSNSKSSNHFFYDITSIHWNNWFSLPGDMLAVCDELGNMTMLIAGQSPEGATTFEKLTMLFQDNIYKIHNHVAPLAQQSDKNIGGTIEKKRTKKEYNTRILDFHWLSSSKSIIISQFCAFDSTSNVYRNKALQIAPSGVFYPPFMKYACMAVRRNGQLDFWYQFSNSKDHKKINLHLLPSQNQRLKELDWFQFARITPMKDDQSILVSGYSKLTKKICFYKVRVNWNTPSTNKNNTLNDPTLTVTPILEVPLSTVDSEGRVLKFYDLVVLSKTAIDKDTSAEVLIVYHICGTQKTLIKRFKLMNSYLAMDFLSVLKPGIESINGGNMQPIKSKHYTLRHGHDIFLDKRVSNITTELLDNFVTFFYDDGSVDVFNQNDWNKERERIKSQSNKSKFLNVMTSALSTGLSFQNIPLSSAIDWVRLSPTMTGIIYKLKTDHVPRFVTLTRPDLTDPSLDELDAIAFAFTFVNSTHRQLSSEDLSVACKAHIKNLSEMSEDRAKEFIMTLMSNLYPFFNVSPDAPKDIMDKMISSRPIQKIMLLQLELGTRLKDERIAQMARVILYLKNVLFAFNGVARNLQFAIEQMNNGNTNASTKMFQTLFSKQDLIYSLIPIANWFVKFVTFLIQEVLLLVNNPSESKNTLVLGVFGAKMPRQLILSVLNEIKKIMQIISKFPETTYPVLNESSTYLRMVLSDTPVNFEKFETFLIDVNNKFTAFSEQQPASEKDNILKREYSLLIQAEVPPSHSRISDFLLAYSCNAVISHIKPSDVYFTDTTGLRLTDTEFLEPNFSHLLQPISEGVVVNLLSEDQNSSKKFSQMTIDGVTYDKFSPKELQNGKMKRCSRCGAVTRAGYVIAEDKTIVPTSIHTKRWPTMYTRTCICSGMLYELQH
ncbi:similar to Saccharomyces cerevisiae YNL236W SIN4 Subunit of the RNA polymerase II mediator complex [Maudiozyma saulgeensis]|uniref:Mediator of RNA polymerase II transcription subunit 16 n=1 Tax=Maudiozyma saulgeensis TaxID=1789683 RepID=A0A1X7R2P3_9SACH|nr:similar to Saccharomyces cerevisiae YNL236W SIN4 Subunit of the RNA polymerase II mediator complex [Kazachstania saulgeensis]